MTVYALGELRPEIAETAWVAPDANVIGAIVLKAGASVWFGATLRGDNEPIVIGEGSNVQENVVMHTDIGFPLDVGPNVTIGHKAMLHGCTIGEDCLIGMGATILNGAVIGAGSLIGAGALVTEGKEIPPGSLVMGAPGKVVRQIDEAALKRMTAGTAYYRQNAERFRAELTET
ncbi:gamma carbonic anhydrase family protein [Roseicyclus sp. F158]|uniref:Gamma carbonic anhydrase family protein n=1 Tax=Tropicimonas omnivorans TaxID=3075590 RepID=A0ABU3DJN5_9RHOB|nr:gamma carbonic anhydrase family protein [Roseicyclus sp. F158]MDT0683912.1 gamma carbonic anhydrase family protein [Roseicyclus sp. F158]